MEYCQGHRIDDIEKLNHQFGKDGALQAAEILVDVFGKMIFLYGHVHCDAHPGNIMVRANPKDPSRP